MQMNRLVVVSGLSGSGKSVALNMLEDLGWYCIDNIPAGLVQSLVSHSVRTEEPDLPAARRRPRRAQPARAISPRSPRW